MKRVIPAIVVILAILWLARSAMLPKQKEEEFPLNEFGKLPIVFQGRVKPIDTLARNSLIILSDKQSFKDKEGKKYSAMYWLLDVISQSEAAMHHPVIRIENHRVLEILGLKPRKGYRYAIDEFHAKFAEFDKAVTQARSQEPELRDVYANKLLELANKFHLFTRLREAFSAPHIKEQQDLLAYFRRVQAFENYKLPHMLPPPEAGHKWTTLSQGVLLEATKRLLDDHRLVSKPHPGVPWIRGMLHAYKDGKVDLFRKNLKSYQNWLATILPSQKKFSFEQVFNQFEPFYRCALIYLVIFLIGLFISLKWNETLYKTAYGLLILATLVHTAALIARIYISGYPPVTNLYSSAIFIGWGCVVLGIVLEGMFRMGIGLLIAAIFGFNTILIAHFLSGDGDTMEMMQAVLDTKFWLATHVTTVTLGYTATFFAGGIAAFAVLKAMFSKGQIEHAKAYDRMIYGTVCFALLLSFVGTVLGGLWADDSWGRFWGWDPKENGALMIVMWNAIILHARWGGMISLRGLSALAIFGNVVTSWSWFGVNELGVGLHSYGFMEGAKFWLIAFALSQLTIILIALAQSKEKYETAAQG